MTQSEKMLVFALAALFHAARIVGEIRDDANPFPDASGSLRHAADFVRAAKDANLAPVLPEDDAR